MLDGVLNQRLQHHRGHRDIAQRLRNLHLGVEAIAHPDLQDLQVGLGALGFLAQGGDGILGAGQGAAQVLDEVAEHEIGAGGIGAGQYLRAGQGVVEEVRFHLRLQQVELGHRQFLLGDGLHGVGLFLAPALADPACDRTDDGFGVFQVGAVVHLQQIAPGAGFRLAQQRHAATAGARRDGGEDLVALGAEPVEHVVSRRAVVAIGIHALELGLDLQAVARAFQFLHPRQFAHRRFDQQEGFVGLQRNLDPAVLAVGQGVVIQPAGDQADPAQVREGADDHRQRDQQRQQGEHRSGCIVVAGDDIESPGPDQAGEQEHAGPGGEDADDEEQAGEHGGSIGVGLPRSIAGRRRRGRGPATEAGFGRRKPPGAGWAVSGGGAGGGPRADPCHRRDGARPASPVSNRWPETPGQMSRCRPHSRLRPKKRVSSSRMPGSQRVVVWKSPMET